MCVFQFLIRKTRQAILVTLHDGFLLAFSLSATRLQLFESRGCLILFVAPARSIVVSTLSWLWNKWNTQKTTRHQLERLLVSRKFFKRQWKNIHIHGKKFSVKEYIMKIKFSFYLWTQSSQILPTGIHCYLFLMHSIQR